MQSARSRLSGCSRRKALSSLSLIAWISRLVAAPSGAARQKGAELDQADVEAIVEPMVESRHRWLAGLLRAEPDDRVLDLGCGTGSSLRVLVPALRGGMAVGVDLVSEALRQASAAIGEAGRTGLVRADLKQPLPLADASFDRVL
jgi:SAM-dependent methyltransferase